ncbi:MAG: hypothetical protein ACFCVK_10530 [Acidimicrobiales bacterium]
MPLDTNALGSISSSLDEITRRIGLMADAAGDDDDTLADLREVERQLETTRRRLDKILRRAGR